MAEQEPTDSQNSQFREISRRDLLRRGGLIAGCVIAGTAVIEYFEQQHKDSEKQAQLNANKLENAKDLAKAFDQGVSREWSVVNVWPGLAIIPSDVELYTTPTLEAETTVDWPSDKTDKHLLAQRPFMARATARANDLHSPGSNHLEVPVAPEVLGFWLPQTNDMVFCNRAAYKSSILLPSHSPLPLYENNFQDVIGEKINLQPPLNHKGLIYRYLKTEEVNYYFSPGDEDIETITKVVARSVWADPAYAAQAFYDFSTGEGPDLIDLPRS